MENFLSPWRNSTVCRRSQQIHSGLWTSLKKKKKRWEHRTNGLAYDGLVRCERQRARLLGVRDHPLPRGLGRRLERGLRGHFGLEEKDLNVPQTPQGKESRPRTGTIKINILKKWANPGLFFVYLRSFLITISIQIEKSVDGVLGIQTRGCRMVATDKTAMAATHIKQISVS